MKFYMLFLSAYVFSAVSADESVRIINNTNQPLHVDYGLPIYSRADTQIKPIKSQQELQDLLHEAILTNSTQEIMQVVNAGADVNIFKDGKAPLAWATSLKKLNSIEVLKKCGAVIPCPKNMLYRAILNDSAEEIRQAVQAGADPKEGMGKAIALARLNSMQTLLECGVVPSVGYALQAMMVGDIKSAVFLLKKTQVNTSSHRELLSWKNYNKHIFEYVLTEIDPTGIRDTVLEFIQAIIDHGYDINSSAFQDREISGQVTELGSAWVHAINNPFHSMKGLELFMKNGANPNQLIYGSGLILTPTTPLFLAIECDNIGAVKFLLGAGADINRVSFRTYPRRENQTPLAYAKTFTHPNNQEIIKLLIKHGAHL